MADVEAKLRAKVTVDGAKQGTVELNNLANAGDRAGKKLDLMDKFVGSANKALNYLAVGMENLNHTYEKGDISLDSYNKKTNQLINTMSRLQKIARGTSDTFNQFGKTQQTYAQIAGSNTREAAQANRFNTGNIAAQFQDIAVTAAMNMNPLTIGLQQGTQLAYVLGQSKAPLADFAAGIKNLISPVTLLSVGLTTLVAVGIQMVDWTNVAKTSLNVLGDIFIGVGTAVENLKPALLVLATSFIYLNKTAIASMLITLESLIVTFGKTALSALATGAKIAASWIIAMGPIGWFTAAVLGVVAVFAKLTNKTEKIENFFTKIGEKIKSLGDNFGETTKKVKEFDKWSDVISKGYEKIADEKFKQSVEGLDTYTKTYKTTIHELAGELLNLQKESNGSFQINEKMLKQAKDLAIATANQAVETERLDKIREEAEAKKAEFEKLEKERIDAYNANIEYASSLTKGYFSDLKSGLQEGQSAWEAFTNAVIKMLDKISDKMMDMAIDAMFDGLKQGQTKKSNNWMSSAVNAIATVLTGGHYYSAAETSAMSSAAQASGQVTMTNASYTGPFAKGGAFSNGVYNSPTMFAFANGGKFGVMGEAGPEAVMPLTRRSDGSLGVRADGMGGGSPVVVNVINNSNARATTQQRQTEQGTTIDVMIDELVAQKLG